MLKKSWLVTTGRRDLFRAKLVFHLFLLSLTVFFAAGMLSYLAIRTTSFRRPDSIAYVTLQIPNCLWFSTALLLVVSVSMHQAVGAIHRNRMQPFHRALGIAAVFASAFVLVQAFGLQELLQKHFSADDGSTKSYGICFTMAFLHALHVMGGMGFLGFVITRSFQQRYDHERHWTVDNCASYWHFLDAVWILMLVTFFIAR